VLVAELVFEETGEFYCWLLVAAVLLVAMIIEFLIWKSSKK
jgi:hypothetical protein